MQSQYIIAITWLAGFLLSRWMLRAEHQAEGKEMNNGDETVCVLLAVFSFGMVLYLLADAWITKVKPYWAKPVKTKKPE